MLNSHTGNAFRYTLRAGTQSGGRGRTYGLSIIEQIRIEPSDYSFEWVNGVNSALEIRKTTERVFYIYCSLFVVVGCALSI